MLDRIINNNTEYCRTAKTKEWKTTMYWISYEKIKRYINSENIYFLSWWNLSKKKEIWHRFSDSDILIKNYFAIDIDLRNQYNWNITNLEIEQEGLYIAEHLYKSNELFWEWSYIVFSWNWLHLYYIWDERQFDKNIYKDWVKYIFDMWDDFIWDEQLYSDKACCNIARIFRLPWTINQKNWAKTKVLAEQNKTSQLFNNIEKYAKIVQKKRDKQQKEIEKQMKKNIWKNNEDYEKIQQIPAFLIAQLLLPEFPYDWKRNFKNKKWWFCWYFYVKDKNAICNWWSRYFIFDWISDSCWWPFQLVRYHLWLTSKETFEYFKNNF